MERNRVRTKGIIGIAVIVVALVCIFVWESYGREAIAYTDVIVFNQDVDAYEVVTETMLGSLSMNKEAVIEGAIQNPEEIIGKTTVTSLPKGAQLTAMFFESGNLSVGEENYIFEIPSAWIYSYPQSLRRGDTIYFYALQTADPGQFQSMNLVEGEMVINTQRTLPLLSASVVYVKDNSNQEVVDTSGNRMNASAPVSNISVIVSQDQYNTLKTSYEQGNQFVLLYR